MAEPPSKRRRLSSTSSEDSTNEDTNEDHTMKKPRKTLASLSNPISPPGRRRPHEHKPIIIPSPIQLTTIRDLPEESNAGAVSLHDLLGDPLIAECWEFNYLHDVDFLMRHFDEDTRSLVKVHIIHGFWKREDSNRLLLEQQSSLYGNVTLHSAFMPEMFGTHHSKMLILFRHDDTAQVIIHTANMISKDWTNMTNGVWQTPRLPLLKSQERSPDVVTDMKLGSGPRFKADLLNYLWAYDTRRTICKPMIKELEKYDFSAVVGALVASIPGKHELYDDDPDKTHWGWSGIKNALRSIPVQPGKSEVAVQISSIATLGGTDTWLKRTLFTALSSSSSSSTKENTSKPEFKVVFPTPDEIRRSLDGYGSGGSIHMKTQSAAQAKQLQYMKPLLQHWANDCEMGTLEEGPPHNSGRNRAAPHIKTYIRYHTSSSSSSTSNISSPKQSIDWALLTSANMSRQAWGEAPNGAGQLRIASWEVGVLLWPALFGDGDSAGMVAVFGTDVPEAKEDEDDDGEKGVDRAPGSSSSSRRRTLVGIRVPYSLPLQKYADTEGPWVATASYTEPDCLGQVWGGY